MTRTLRAPFLGGDDSSPHPDRRQIGSKDGAAGDYDVHGRTYKRHRCPDPRFEARVETMPMPADCTDGFVEAFWNRPEAFLDPEVRASQSVWPLLGPEGEERIVERLRSALESGAWDAEHGHLRELESFDGALRLVISEPALADRRRNRSEEVVVRRLDV